MAAAYRTIAYGGTLYIIYLILVQPHNPYSTAPWLFALACLAWLWQVRNHADYYIAASMILLIQVLPPSGRPRATSWFINVKSGFTLLADFTPVIVAAALTCGLAWLLGEKYPLHMAHPIGIHYMETYLAIAGASLTFPALTIAINIWKQSTAEARLVTQATSLRDYLFRLADDLEGSPRKETPGTISLKGAAETLNDIIFSPANFDKPRLNQWLMSVLSHREVLAAIRPSALTGMRSIEAPILQMSIWRTTIASAINFAVYAGLTNVLLEISGSRTANAYGAAIAVAVFCIALRATVRLTADGRTATGDPAAKIGI
jgi:hypothetical protein